MTFLQSSFYTSMLMPGINHARTWEVCDNNLLHLLVVVHLCWGDPRRCCKKRVTYFCYSCYRHPTTGYISDVSHAYFGAHEVSQDHVVMYHKVSTLDSYLLFSLWSTGVIGIGLGIESIRWHQFVLSYAFPTWSLYRSPTGFFHVVRCSPPSSQ